MKGNQTISLYCKNFTSRLRFANHVVFELLLGLELIEYWEISAFEAIETPKVSYSLLNVGNSFHIVPVSLLFEQEIIHKKLQHTRSEIPLIFSTEDADLEFDPLAAAFYVVSRYEEYLPHKKDKHDRFPARNSLQFIMGILDIPIVHAWAHLLSEKLKAKYPSLEITKPKFQYIPCLLYTSPSPRDATLSRMPSSA